MYCTQRAPQTALANYLPLLPPTLKSIEHLNKRGQKVAITETKYPTKLL